jgi:stage II sporulation protein AA (anti-sigma F factor antagonist)
MRVECSPDVEVADALVASLDGFFDQTGATLLWESVAPHLTGGAATSLLVDLSGVNLMTSAGVGVLVRLLHRVDSLGGRLALFGAGRRVREVIEVVRLREVLNLSDSAEEARQRLRASR